jgi:hypothetical protein
MAGGKLTSTSTIVCAGLAGGAAGLVGNPTEVGVPLILNSGSVTDVQESRLSSYACVQMA